MNRLAQKNMPGESQFPPTMHRRRGKTALVIAATAVAADTASAFETLASPISKPATAAMTPPTRMTVPNNAVAVIATRRGFIAPSLLGVMLGPSVRQPDLSDRK